MDTIFEQQYQQILLQFVRSSTDSKVEWKLLLTNIKSNKELILHSDSMDKNAAWKHQESVGESPINLYNIAGCFFDAKILYVIFNRFGEVFIAKYNLESDKFEKNEKIIRGYLASGGFGSMINHAQFIKINTDIYFSLNAGQSFTGAALDIFRLNSNSFEIKRIVFNNNPISVATICINNYGKLAYEQTKKKIADYEKLSGSEKKENQFLAPTESELNVFSLLNEYLNNPFYFKVLNTDVAKRSEEKTNLRNIGLTDYPLFGVEDNLHNIDKRKITNAEQYIKQTLTVYGDTQATEVKLLDFIYDSGQENIIYFFYQENSIDIQIIRYDNYDNLWLIGGFKEEKTNALTTKKDIH